MYSSKTRRAQASSARPCIVCSATPWVPSSSACVALFAVTRPSGEGPGECWSRNALANSVALLKAPSSRT